MGFLINNFGYGFLDLGSASLMDTVNLPINSSLSP